MCVSIKVPVTGLTNWNMGVPREWQQGSWQARMLSY